MSSQSEVADGGTFAPETVTTTAEIAESLRNPKGRHAGKVKQILEKTNSVAIKLKSGWNGNEAFGQWSEWFFVKPNGISDGGALFVSEGISLNEPVKKLTSAERVRKKRGGLTEKAARKMERKAMNWDDTSKPPGPGMPSSEERPYFKGVSTPLAWIEQAFRLPESEDDAVLTSDGERTGKMSEGDIRVTHKKATQYGTKLALEGDTYDILSSKGENLSDDIPWNPAQCGWDGDDWSCKADNEALLAVVKTLTEAGYTVTVAEKLKGYLTEPDSSTEEDVADSFGVDL